MAKDPAFLFYPGDWLGGTMTLTRHQKGCYIDLLMAQFNSGPLSLDQIKLVLGQDQAVWTVLQDKFQKDNSERFFNKKLATEIEKRKNFTASRSNNKSGRKKSYDKSYENHMTQHMENENEDENIIVEKGVLGEKTSNQLSEEDFIDIWKRARAFYDKNPTGFDRLISFERQCFNQLLKDGFTKQDFEFAVAGLFFQKTVPAVRVRPDWLLKPENFTKMLDCWKNQSKIFDNTDKQSSGSKFVKGDV